MNELEHGTIFEKGVPNPFGEYFSGQSYLAMLTQLNGVGVANVTFDLPAGNNWHIHTVIKAADRFCLSPAGAAGIRNGARRHRSFMREMWLPFLWVSSTGMGRQRIVGLRILQ